MNGYNAFSLITLNFFDVSKAFYSKYWSKNMSNCV